MIYSENYLFYNWVEKSTKFPIPKMKLNKSNASIPVRVKCLENLEKGQVFKNLSRTAYVYFNPSKKLLLNALAMVTNKALIVCSCLVTYTIQSESTLYSRLNVKELLARTRREIWSLSDGQLDSNPELLSS